MKLDKKIEKRPKHDGWQEKLPNLLKIQYAAAEPRRLGSLVSKQRFRKEAGEGDKCECGQIQEAIKMQPGAGSAAEWQVALCKQTTLIGSYRYL